MGGPLAGPHDECGPVIPSYCGECVSPGQLKNTMPTAKNNIGLNDEINVKDELKILVGHRKRNSGRLL